MEYDTLSTIDKNTIYHIEDADVIPGASAYEIYVAKTEDDPVLTEAQ